MKVISISNIKGGVSKSTTASVLGSGLAMKGYKVLLVDNDPQTNLSMCYLPEQPDGTPSLYHVYNGEKGIDEVKVAIKDGLDLLIGDFELSNADIRFLKAGRLKMLYKAFKNLKTSYDFVIIDNPPNLGILSLNAFLVTDYIIVPMAADSFSLKGVLLLKQTLNDVSDETEKEIPVAGILLTRYTSRTNTSRLLEKSLNSAAEMLDTKIFDSRIRQAVVVQESQIAKENLLAYAPKAPVTEDYWRFIEEFLERIGE